MNVCLFLTHAFPVDILNEVLTSQNSIYFEFEIWLCCMGGSPGELREECDVGEVKEWLENELWRKWSNGMVGEWAVT